MKFSMQRVIEGFLGLAVLGLLAVLVIPVKEPPLASRTSSRAEERSEASAGAPVSAARADLTTVLLLFGVNGSQSSTGAAVPVAKKPGDTELKKPVDAPWLNYIGCFTPADGKPYHIIKDSRSGKLIKVTEGQTTNGWSIVEISANRIVIRNNTDVYSLNKR
jgi:hypothetical protein